MVFKEFVGFLFGGVEVPFRVGQMAIEWVTENLFKMSKTLLVANDLDVIRSAKVFQFLDFLSGEGIGRRNVRMALGLEGMLGVERECIQLAFSHLGNEAFQIIHTDDGTAADVILPCSNLEVGPVGDGHARYGNIAFVAEEGITIKLL